MAIEFSQTASKEHTKFRALLVENPIETTGSIQ